MDDNMIYLFSNKLKAETSAKLLHKLKDKSDINHNEYSIVVQ